MHLRRITHEFEDLQKNPLDGCFAAPNTENNLQHWNATIAGPRNTPYENGAFRLSVHYPDDYSRNPLHVTFMTPIFHPNVSRKGELRLAEFEKTQWCPAITIRIVLISIQAMLSDPNLENGCMMNAEAMKLFLEDLTSFEDMASRMTMAHAYQKTIPN